MQLITLHKNLHCQTEAQWACSVLGLSFRISASSNRKVRIKIYTLFRTDHKKQMHIPEHHHFEKWTRSLWIGNKSTHVLLHHFDDLVLLLGTANDTYSYKNVQVYDSSDNKSDLKQWTLMIYKLEYKSQVERKIINDTYHHIFSFQNQISNSPLKT